LIGLKKAYIRAIHIWQRDNNARDATTPKNLQAKVAPSKPTADGGLVARILVVEVALEKPFFSWNNNHRDEANSWNKHYEQPKVIQPN
jgi:hypothetical protein